MKNGIGFLLLLVFIMACSTAKNDNSILVSTFLFTDIAKCSISGDSQWDMVNKSLIGSEGIGYISTKEQYDNFVLTAEFYPEGNINSGIFVRCPERVGSAVDCYEINIWDNHINQEFRTGAIVTHGKPLSKIHTVDKWNKYKIIADKDHIEVWLNGIKTADLVDGKTRKGFIVLQNNGDSRIKFKNVEVQIMR